MDDSKEFFDAAVILPDDEADDAEDEPVKAASSKNHITELRRRIEERLERKRIDHEYDYDDFDGVEVDIDRLLDNLS